MATAEEYATWIVENAGKKGTPEFDIVAKAYQEAKGAPADAPAAPTDKPTSWGGVAAEAGKGLLRGAADVGALAQRGGLGMIPIVGPMIANKLESLQAPMRKPIEARAENPTEQFAGTAGEIAGGGIAGGGAGSLRAGLMTAASALGGAAGEQVGGTAGRVAGTLLPAAPGLLGAGVKRFARGPADAAQARLETMESAGVNPTLADIAPNRAAAQNLAARVPGAQQITKKALDTQTRQFKEQIDELTPDLTASSQRAGEAVQEGLHSWKTRFYKNWEKLDARVTATMGDTPVELSNTRPLLDKLVNRIDDPALNKIFQSGTISQIREALAGGAPIPFPVAQQLKSEIGKKAHAGFANIKSDADVGELKALYKSIAQDIETSAPPEAAAAIKRANQLYSSGSDRIDAHYRRIFKQANPEDVFNSLMTKGKKGAVEVRNVMKVLGPEERDIVASAALTRMGQAKAGVRSEETPFSVQTLLTDWNTLDPAAKRALFSGTTRPGMLQDMDRIANAAGLVREGGKVMANPSGTGQVVVAGGVVGSLIAEPIKAMSALTGMSAAAYLMTNPKFVHWLAQSTRISPEQMGAHIGRLSTLGGDDPELKEVLVDYSRLLQ